MAISVGSVEVDVVPNTRGIYGRLRAGLVPAATRAGEDAGSAAGRAFGPAMRSEVAGAGERIGRQLGSEIAQRMSAEIRGALRDGITQGGRTARPAATRQGSETGGAFARAARARIEAAFRSLPDITIGADTSEADSDLQALRARMEALSSRTIGVDLDAAEARTQIEEIEAELRRLGSSHPDVSVRADTARARAELSALREEIDRVSADPARIRIETDGTFGQRLRAQVQAAEASLPNININADTTAAQAEVASLRARLTALRDVRIGVDMDAAAAQAQIADIQARLARLSASDADVAVRVDTGAAAAQLAAVQAMVNRLDGQTATVNVDTRAAMRALLQLSVAIAGVAAIPAIPVAAAGIGSIAAAATAAGAGVGALAAVAIPAFSGIKGALDAQKQAQEAATTATAQGGQAAAQAARQALSMAGAQQQLAAAERNGARQIAAAQAQVRQAKQAVAQAVASAAQRQQAAARAVQDAERSLAQAQRDARQAQEDLTEARRTAAQELQDLNSQFAGAQLSQRDAVLSVREAELDLQRARASNAGGLQMARAQLAYDQAVQRLKDQTVETKRLKAETAAANKAGVAGSDTVRSAQERLRSAQEQVADRARAVRDAQSEAARVQVQTSREVAAAQERVGEATRNVAVAQQAAADAVASAQRQIQSAQLASVGGANAAATAQAKYQAALAKLSPSARGTFNAFVRLRTAFQTWSKSLQPAVMPIFTRALNGMRKALPGLTPFVLAAARAITILQNKVSQGFKSPWWKSFKADLARSVTPAIVGLGVAFGRIFKGMAGIIQAFLPHMDSISNRMQGMTARFANWGTGLKGSPEFERFLDYAATMGPKLADTLGKIAGAFYQVSMALAPLSGPILTVLGVLAEGIATVAEHAPWLIQGIYGLILATKLWTIAQRIFNAVMSMNPLVRVALLIGLLVTAVIYAYNRFGWFRAGVQAAWNGIKAAVLFVWNSVLKPVFNGIMVAIRFVGRIVMWLWRNVFGPAFRGIATVAKWLLVVLAVLVVGPIVLAFRALAAVGRWLWRNVLAPAFRGIAAVGRWLWNNVLRPIIRLWVLQFRALAAVGRWLWRTALAPAFRGIATVAKWLWNKAIRPVFNWIADKAKWVWTHGIKPAFEWIKKGIKKVVTAFQLGRDGIGKAWDKIKNLTKKPIKWVIDIVYNKGVRGLWNAAASVLPIKKLPAFKPKGFATGGKVWGPGTATSDSIPARLSRGEHVWTAKEVQGAGGHAAMESMRQAARGGFAKGGPVNAGGVPGFAQGGVVDWFKSGASAVGGAIKSGFGKLKDLALGGVYKAVNAAAGPVRSLLDKIPGGKTGFGKLATALPKSLISEVLSAVKGSETGAMGGAGVARALKWVKGQAGKPYQWGGAGNPSFDCSGLLSSTQKVIQGKNPKGRLWSTFSFQGKQAPAGWKYHAKSPFQIGITNKGKGHTAGTLAGTKIESRGGDGVVVGSRARGYNHPMFGNRWYGFLPARGGGVTGGSAKSAARQMLGEYGWSQKQWPPLEKLWQKESGWRWNARNPSSGAYGIPQALPASKMRSAGADWKTNPATQIKWGLKYIKGRYGSPSRAWAHSQRVNWYDSGGYLPEGLSTVYNGTGSPEPVLTRPQLNALTGAAVRGSDGAASPSGPGEFSGNLYLEGGEFLGKVRGVVRQENAAVVSALGARAGR